MNFRTFLYWLIVSVPLTCGVLLSVNTALPLFGSKSVVIPYLTPLAVPAKPVVKPVMSDPSTAAVPPSNATPAPDAAATP